MRYFVYSLDTSNPPNKPIFESYSEEDCIDVCCRLSRENDATVYVVDRFKNNYQEIIVCISSKFKEDYMNMISRIDELKQ